jgi:hypothetical protein
LSILILAFDGCHEPHLNFLADERRLSDMQRREIEIEDAKKGEDRFRNSKKAAPLIHNQRTGASLYPS